MRQHKKINLGGIDQFPTKLIFMKYFGYKFHGKAGQKS